MKRLVASFFLSQALLLGVFAYAVEDQRSHEKDDTYAQAVKDREDKVAGCRRNTLDRIDNANGWLVQSQADAAVGHDPEQPAKSRRVRLHAARAHRARASRERSRIVDCRTAFPPVPKP